MRKENRNDVGSFLWNWQSNWQDDEQISVGFTERVFFSKCNVNCIIYQQVCALWRGFPSTVFTIAHYFIFCAIHSVQLSHFAGECKKTYRIIEAINFHFIRELACHSSIDEIDINMSTQRKTYRSSPKSPSIITKSQSNYVMANVMDDNRH